LKHTYIHTRTYTYTDIDIQTHIQAHMYISIYVIVSASTLRTFYEDAFPRHRQPCHSLFSSSICITLNLSSSAYHQPRTSNFTPILLPHFTSSPLTLPSDLFNAFPNQMQLYCSTPEATPFPHSSREIPDSSYHQPQISNFTPILLPHFTSSPHTLPSDLSNTLPNQMQLYCSTPGATPFPHSSREYPNSSAPPQALSERGRVCPLKLSKSRNSPL
jgi:hypothetical protein